MILDPYEVLSVPRDADIKIIKDAHRKGVRKHHPDAGGDPEKFGALQRSYEILSDPGKRERYDRTGETEDKSAAQQESEILNNVNHLIEMVINDAMDLETTNLRQVMIDTLHKTSNELAFQARDVKLKLRRHERLEKGFRRRKRRKAEGEDRESAIMRLALKAARDKLLLSQKAIEQAQAMHERIIGVFQAFDYDFTVPEPTVMPRGFFQDKYGIQT